MALPKKVDQRITSGSQKYRIILEQARARDVNEADTGTIVKGLLAEVFGWHPFFEVTSEFAIRSTFCDLAVKSDDQVVYLIEVKAIGSDLRDNHLRQAIGYASTHGIEWVVLTNGVVWQAHRVVFAKPVTHDMVFELNFIDDNFRSSEFREKTFLLTKEGMTKSAIAQFHAERQAFNRFNIAAILQEEAVLNMLRRELRRAFPGLNPPLDQLRSALISEVLKREVVEGEKAAEAVKAMKRAARRALRKGKGTAAVEALADDAEPGGLAIAPPAV